MQKNYAFNEAVKIDTIKEMMDLAVRDAAKNIAFEYRNEKNKEEIIKVTYEEFQKDTYYLGTALSTMNMLKNHIAVIGDNSYEWLTVYLTVLKSNGVIVPLDKELTAKEIINVIKSSESEVLFYSDKYEKYIEEFKKELPNVKYFINFQKEDDDENSLSYSKFMEKGNKFCLSTGRIFVAIKNILNMFINPNF